MTIYQTPVFAVVSYLRCTVYRHPFEFPRKANVSDFCVAFCLQLSGTISASMFWHFLTWYSIAAFLYYHVQQPSFHVTLRLLKFMTLCAVIQYTLHTMIIGKLYDQQLCKWYSAFPFLPRSCFLVICLSATVFVVAFPGNKTFFVQ